MKKILLSLLIGAIAVSCSDNIQQKTNVDEILKNRMDESKSLDVFQELNGTVNYVRATGEIVYPRYYSGAYIDGEGVLTVLVTDASEKCISDLQRRAKSSAFKVKECNYSLDELMELKDELSIKFKNKELKKEIGWVSVGIVLRDNKVEVRLSDCSDLYIEKFKTLVSGSPMIQFVEMKPIEIVPGYIEEESSEAIAVQSNKTKPVAAGNETRESCKE